MNPLLIPTKLIQYARLTFSSEYAKRTAEAYWRNTTSTHTVMDEAAFHQMFTELSKLIGPVDGLSLLDYGAGNGELATRFRAAGARVEAMEVVQHFVDTMKRSGLSAHLRTVPPGNEYDVVLFNNALFYAHPSTHATLLRELAQLTRSGGRLFITDTPDFRKRARGNALPAYGPLVKELYYALTSIFPVYQRQLAGFFVDFEKLVKQARAAGFREARVMDSWSAYRSHLVLTK